LFIGAGPGPPGGLAQPRQLIEYYHWHQSTEPLGTTRNREPVVKTDSESEWHSPGETLANRQTDGLTDTDTGPWPLRKTDTQALADRQTDLQTDKQTDRRPQRLRQTDTDTHWQTHRRN